MASDATPSRDAARAPGPVDRAFALLQIVVASPQPIGVRELARRAGLAPSTTARTLGILDDLGMVERTPEGAARPGTALATLTHEFEQSPAALRDRLRPLTVDLMQEFGESAAIAVDDGEGMFYVVSSRVDGALQVPDPTGDRHAFHLVAPGLVAMTFWNEARLDTHLATTLDAATPFSVVEAKQVRKRIKRVRHNGHAWTDQELDIDVNGLAVPITDDSGDLVAVASLYGPAHRLNPARRPDLAKQLRDHVLERTGDLS